MKFKDAELENQVQEFFESYNKEEVATHSIEVANEARKMAKTFGLPEEKAFIAGLLHDTGIVIPQEDRVPLHISLNEKVFEEEKELPMILHQKQSVFISREVFGITDEQILSAIESHTTLKKNATELDKLIFIADKVKWDRTDNAPYLDDLNKALRNSLDEGCKVYIKWALSDIIVFHPWLKEAMDDLKISYLTD
ncbi:bis(5'-nucleosyl)-tetraphosphatase (symmetrical) YqeK [Vagococcus silagei]